jgi:hypothetical protein
VPLFCFRRLRVLDGRFQFFGFRLIAADVAELWRPLDETALAHEWVHARRAKRSPAAQNSRGLEPLAKAANLTPSTLAGDCSLECEQSGPQ